MTTSNPTDAPPELLPQIRRRFERALDAARNFKGMSAGSPKVMLEISDVDYLLKWLRALKWLGTRAPSASAGQGGDLARAIADAEYGRKTHQEWLDYLEHPHRDTNDGVVIEDVGSVEHQREWIARYDNILACLRATPSPSPAPRPACMNPDCIDGKVSVGCAIDKPLLTKNCPDCNPPRRDRKSNAALGDPTRFLDRSFTVVENSGRNIRLINREDPAQALTLPWDDLAPLREIITLVLNDGPMVIGPAPDKGEVARRAAEKITKVFPQVENELSEQDAAKAIAAIIEAELGESR